MPGASSVTNGGGATKRRISEPVHTKGGSAGFSNSFSGAGSAASSSRANGTNGGTGGTGSQISPGTVMKMKADAFEKNREKFMNTFDKPTQIYRFLRARMLESPVFLQRNLSYMQARMSRSHKSRDGFKVDNMLEARQQREKEKSKRLASPRGSIGMFTSKGPAAVNFFNIFVTGVSDGQMWLPDTKARVDIFIARLCLSKRKEGLGNSNKIFEKFVDVKMFSPVSPTSSHEIVIPLPQKCPVVSVPAADCTNGTNGHTVLSYNLVMRVSVPRACLQQVKSEQQSSNHLNSRNNNNNNSDNLDEPKAKRRRSAPTTKDRENFIYEGDACKGSSGGAGGVGGDPSQDLVVYTGYVSLYEKDIPGDKIRDMDYEITLQRAKRGAMKKVSLQGIRRGVTWESLDEKHNKVLEQAKPAGKCAKICISIRTAAEEPATQFVTPPLPLMSKDIKNEDGALNDMSLAKQERKSVRIIYHFMHENFSQQQTESRDDLRCSWCSLNCLELYSLLKHFKLCHARFMFTYTAIPNGAKIDVSINESYDASYSGSAYDLVAQPPGEAFARNGPTKRTEVFSILVCRPKPVKQSLQEFFDCDEKDVDQRRTYITGHNRLYHHTSTCLPIHPREIDVDSEGEPDPEWLRVKTTMMIDEFTDVNEGEKELMKLWNLHVMKYNYVGDCQIPLACKRFVELHGRELIQKNLYRNFCLHLTNLSDFGLLTPHGIHNTIQLLHSQMKDASSHSSPLMILGAMDTSKSSQRNSNSQVKNGGINGVDVKPNHSFAILNASNKSGATSSKTVSSTNTATSNVFNSTSNATANTASAATALLNSSRKVEVKLAKLGSQAGSRNGNSANK